MLNKNFFIESKDFYNIIHILGIKLKVRANAYKKLANLKINNKKIVFINYFGKSYGCNPKYITEEFLRQNSDYELVWLVIDPKNEKNNFPKSVKLVPYYSLEAMEELATAGVWVDNMRKVFFWKHGLKKKKGQIYIQTWHGSLGIKNIEGDIKNESRSWRKWAKVDSANIDYILSNSRFDDELFKRCFWYSGPIVRTGHPRNDIFFSPNMEQIKTKVYSALNIPQNSKIILYAPTFRDDGDISCLNVDFSNVQKALSEKFGGEYSVVLRLHPNAAQYAEEICQNAVNGTEYPDIQELLAVSEILISDYSSCMFDFMLTKRPVFIYATDIHKYKLERGFAYPLETTPFPIASDNTELIENIKNFDNNKYLEDANKFLNFWDCTESGNSSKQTLELIKGKQC